MSAPKKPITEIQKLRNDLQLVIQKLTVATEVLHYCRVADYRNVGDIAQNIIDAFDNENTFWLNTQHKAVFDLVELFDKPVREVLNDLRSDADPVFHLSGSTRASSLYD